MGPEPTLLIAVDGEVEDTGGREKKEVGGSVSIPPETSNPTATTVDLTTHSFSQ